MSSFWDWLERKLEIQDDPLPKLVDCIIGIGCDVANTLDGCSPQCTAIVESIASLYVTGHATRVLLVGGYRDPAFPGSACEAERMGKALTMSISDATVTLETTSVTTLMNAERSLPILERHNVHSVIIVAQQWHARRVRTIFTKCFTPAGIRVYVVKARSPYGPGGTQKRFEHFVKFAFWDTLGFLHGKIHGYI